MKRVAIYRRVSEITTSNIDGSMRDQLTRCQAYIAQQGWTQVGDYEEAGKSAYNEKNLDKRTKYQQMLRDAKAGLFDVVMVYKYDRFSRRTRIALQARYELDNAGVEIVSVSEPFDTRTAAGAFGVRQMLSVAELFSDMLSERLTMARASEVARGRHVGPVPVGYATQGKGELARSAPYDALVVQACTLYAPGQLSPGKIASALNDAGYTMPTGRPLIAQDVRRIVANAQIYGGYVRSADVWIRGNHEAIIDDDLMARVLATFERRGVAQDRRFVRTGDPTALLAGLVFCADCEAKMHYSIDRRKTPIWRAYRCKTKADGGACDAPYVVAEPIEAQMLDTLGALSLALDGNWIEEALSIAEAQLATPAEPRRTVDPAKVQEKIRRLGQLYADGIKSDAEYQAELLSLRAQLQSTTAQAAPRRRVSLQEVAERLRDIPALLEAATIGERRAVLNECVDQVYARKGTITALRPTLLFEPLLIAARSRVITTGYQTSDRNSATVEIPALLPARDYAIGGAR